MLSVVDSCLSTAHTSQLCFSAFGAGATSKGGRTYECSHYRSVVALALRRHAQRLLTQLAR
jgi:hypothetical protein